jgi:2-polyprenyl-3-methyl-5-hydroxy-6-metoxy-1,4-benzoquinol methylase
MSSREERLAIHAMPFAQSDDYMPNPPAHLYNRRDLSHFEMALAFANECQATSSLDIGSFDGWLSFLLAERGLRVTGLELRPELVDASRRYAKANRVHWNCHQGFAQEIDFLDNQFDVVYCFETLEHMTFTEAKEVVRNMLRWAKKGIMVSIPEQPAEDNAQHLVDGTREVAEMLVPGGVVIRQTYPGTPIPANFFISKRGLEW